MNWYAIRTKPHQERHVELQLRRCGVETFLPCLEESRMIRRCRRIVVSPLFPGYLFGRLDLKEHYRTVNYTRGGLGVVSFGSIPAQMNEAMIDSIRVRLTNGIFKPQGHCLIPGQTVQIRSGPMSGLEAIFQYQLTGQQRASLLLRCLAFPSRLVVPMEQLVNG
jgi:transcriptional antiterminator RfaH